MRDSNVPLTNMKKISTGNVKKKNATSKLNLIEHT